jgi:hypothetical protein
LSLVGLEFKLRASRLQSRLYCLSHTFTVFCSGYFGDGVSQTVCPDWPQNSILLISSSQVARITGMSHWHLAQIKLLYQTKEFKIYIEGSRKPLMYLKQEGTHYVQKL